MKYLLLVLALTLPCHGQMLQAIVGQSSAAGPTHKTSALVAGQVCTVAWSSSTSSGNCVFPGNLTVSTSNAVFCRLFYQSASVTITSVTVLNNSQALSAVTNDPVRGATSTAAIYYLIGITGTPLATINIILSGNAAAGIACEERTNIASFDTSSVGATGTTTVNTDPITGGSVNTAQDNELAIFGGGQKTASGVDSWTITGWTIDSQRDGGTQTEFLATQTVSAAGAVTPSGTNSNTTVGEWTAQVAAFKTVAN